MGSVRGEVPTLISVRHAGGSAINSASPFVTLIPKNVETCAFCEGGNIVLNTHQFSRHRKLPDTLFFSYICRDVSAEIVGHFFRTYFTCVVQLLLPSRSHSLSAHLFSLSLSLSLSRQRGGRGRDRRRQREITRGGGGGIAGGREVILIAIFEQHVKYARKK